MSTSFEALAGEFLRGVDAEFAADGDLAGGWSKHVGQFVGENVVVWRNDAAEREVWLDTAMNDLFLPGRIPLSDYPGQRATGIGGLPKEPAAGGSAARRRSRAVRASQPRALGRIPFGMQSRTQIHVLRHRST